MNLSLHEYLDMHLGDHPSDADIAQAKENYWKEYRTEHRKQRRQTAKVLQLTLELELWNMLVGEAQKANVDVYSRIKQKLQSIETKREVFLIKRRLYQCLDLLDQGHPAFASIESIIAEL